MAIAVLPVCLSPIISSLCPRPIGIIASIALIPVWSGCLTGCRNITPGAFLSNGRLKSSPFIGPLPSRGCPVGVITLPNKPSPTPREAILPVLLTISPSFISSVGPSNTAPILSSSRFSTIASIPFSNSISSFDCAFESPYIRAIPSPT